MLCIKIKRHPGGCPGGLSARPRTSVCVPSGQIHFAQRVFNHKGSPENLFSGEMKKVTQMSDF